MKKLQNFRQYVLFYVIPAVLLLFFAFLMNSAVFLQHSFQAEEKISFYAEQMKKNIHAGQWEKVEENYTDLKTMIEKITPYLQFSAEKDKLEEIDKTFARLQAFIENQNSSFVLAELYTILQQWQSITH